MNQVKSIVMEDNELFNKIEEAVKRSCEIESGLFEQFEVKRGLRNKDGTGVLVGLTNIGDVVGYKKENGKVIAIPGRLLYRGIDIEDITDGFQRENRHGFTETTYLLLTGHLPNKQELQAYEAHMASLRSLPDDFTKDMILSMKGKDVLNILARSVLGLYILDENPDDISLDNMIRQSMNIMSKFPTIVAYSYQALRHLYKGKTLSIRHPQANLSAAENFLYLIKGDCAGFTKLEADLLDLLLVLHAEHGGGNNSTFTMRVTSSTETDIYSSITSAIGSLKGPLHGGANIRALLMMENIKENVKDWTDEAEVEAYLLKILNKKANDNSGKIYGIGHAVYTISDPRAVILKKKARELAIEKGRLDEFELYERVEKLTPEVFRKFKGEQAKIVCINVDFYSGFVYSCLGISQELYTPLFAIARVSGWCVHRIEELTFSAKRIIRPAFKNVCEKQEYIPLDLR
ncbi:MAG TPA: citrate synthase [Bacteroidales bacterium]|nr:citrate synthase [Bacteroidales bacterium]